MSLLLALKNNWTFDGDDTLMTPDSLARLVLAAIQKQWPEVTESSLFRVVRVGTAKREELLPPGIAEYAFQKFGARVWNEKHTQEARVEVQAVLVGELLYIVRPEENS